jgi:hypothetical protein
MMMAIMLLVIKYKQEFYLTKMIYINLQKK